MSRSGFRGVVFAAVVPGVVGVLGSGCASVEVTKIAAKTQKPSNVALYVDVHDGSGDGIKGLDEKSFNLYEDGKLMPANKARRALLPPRALGTKYTLLLVDLSGPIASQDLSGIATTIGRFVTQLADKQEVAVSVFDGNDEVAPFLGFGAGSEQVPGLVDSLRKFKPRDANTNWNGAIYQGLHGLEEQLAASTFSQKSAALVIFTDRGTDLAYRVGIEAMKKKVRSSPADIFVIGAGSNINKPELNEIGRTGAFLSTDPRAYQKGFDEVAHKLSAANEGRYVFSYCSPKRKGEHTAELEVLAPSGKMARVSYRFSAEGFKSGCSPRRAPSLNDEPARQQETASEGGGDAPSGGAAAADSQSSPKDDAPSPPKEKGKSKNKDRDDDKDEAASAVN